MPQKSESLESCFLVGSAKRVYAVCALAFALSIVLVGYDKPFSDWLHWSLVPVDRILQIITFFGDGRFLIPASLVFWIASRALKSRCQSTSLVVLASAASAGIAVHFLKALFGRPRPYLEGDSRFPVMDFTKFHWLNTQADFHSFPSGHTTITFGVLWVLFSLNFSKGVRALIVFLMILIPFSRVALGKHFLADTISAAAVGIAVSQLVIEFFKARWRKNISLG